MSFQAFFSLLKDFWQLGERPTDQEAAVAGRLARLAQEAADQEEAPQKTKTLTV